jgi:hypothetical protein
MTTLEKALENLILKDDEQIVLQNSDSQYKQECEWVQDIKYEEPNEYEKNLIKDTLTPEQLLQQEKEEEENKPIKTQEELDKEYKEAYILRVKVIAMHKMDKSIISNPSFWKHEHKQQLILEMQNILDSYSEEEITTKFNYIVNEHLFDKKKDYENFPLKRS